MIALIAMMSLSAPTFAEPILVYGLFAQADTAAPAEDLTPTLDDAPGLINTLVQAVRERNWQLVVAMIVMLIVVLANFILLKLDILGEEKRKIALPWISVGTACLVTFAGALIAGTPWWSALLAGFVTGGAAIGLWELVFKHLGQLVAKKPKTPESP